MTGWSHETKRLGFHFGFDHEFGPCNECDGMLVCGICGEHRQAEHPMERAVRYHRKYQRVPRNWVGIADRLAQAMDHASADGYCTLTAAEHAALAAYHKAKQRDIEP